MDEVLSGMNYSVKGTMGFPVKHKYKLLDQYDPNLTCRQMAELIGAPTMYVRTASRLYGLLFARSPMGRPPQEAPVPSKGPARPRKVFAPRLSKSAYASIRPRDAKGQFLPKETTHD